MIRRAPGSTGTDTPFPVTTLCRSCVAPASSTALEPVELLLPDEKSISALLRERDDLSALMIVAGADATLYAEPRVLERMAPYAGLLLNEAARERTLQRLGIASRSEERRGGQEGVSTSRYRCTQDN